MTSLLGQQLGEYVMRSELGRGSMGIVYRATHVSQGTDFAVKVLLEALGSDESFVIRFNQEADVVRYLHHPNIIRVFERGKDADWLYFVMEYYPGATAGQLLKQSKRLAPKHVVDIAGQTADALAYAHANGHLVHRDIKPENLMVGAGWRIKVLDFGLARVLGAKSITSAGTVVGSLYYVSPEQLRNKTLDGRSDVYALGVSMYEMLSGRRPFLGQTFTELTTAILKGNCVPLGQLETERAVGAGAHRGARDGQRGRGTLQFSRRPLARAARGALLPFRGRLRSAAADAGGDAGQAAAANRPATALAASGEPHSSPA